MLPKHKLNKLLFQLLVLILPTQLGLHFWPSWSYLFGIRIDYFSPTLYVTDILILLIIIRFVFSHRKNLPGWIRSYSGWLVALIVFSVLNIIFSSNWQIAAFKWLRIYECVMLVFYVAYEKNLNIKTWLVKPLSFSLLFVSVLGIYQFIAGKTLGGLGYWMGERTFNITSPGIALVNILGVNHLRAYATFSHPNSLAGYLGVSILILLFFKKSVPRILFAPILTAFVFTFSKAATLSLLAASLLTLKINMDFKHLKTYFLFGLIVSLPVAVILYLQPNLYLNWGSSVVERFELMSVSLEMFMKNPLFGQGLNNFIYVLPSYVSKYPEVWILQPVHNIYLLALTELGIIGIMVVISLARTAVFNNNKFLLSILLFI